MSQNINLRHSDRYGYYEVGNNTVYSKWEFINKIYQLPQKWRWIYNDDLFEKYDWTHEPVEPINELYKKRALQLRQDYDYLVLYYSGGHDSCQMLYSFLDNGIHVDEVCIYYCRQDKKSLQYQEQKYFTLPKIKLLKEKYPFLKFRFLDFTEHVKKWDKIIEEVCPGLDLLDAQGIWHGMSQLVRNFSYRYVDDWKKLLRKGKKVAWMNAVDKPRLRFLNGKWIFNFLDALTNGQIKPVLQIVDNGTIGANEMFFWGPSETCAKIIIKQCHLIKNAYDTQAKEDFSKISIAKKFKEGYGWELDNMSSEFLKLIYPRLFQAEEKFFLVKGYGIYGNKDQWLINSNNESGQLVKDMENVLLQEKNSHLTKWFNNGKNWDDGWVGCISRDYYI